MVTSLWAWAGVTLLWLVAAAAVLAIGEVQVARKSRR